MKYLFLVAFCLINYVKLTGQVGFDEVLVSEDSGGFVGGVFTIDLDGDGDKDILSSTSAYGLNWFENIDGFGNYGPAKLIVQPTGNYKSISPADFDNDGDIDLLSVSLDGSLSIGWYVNDGLGNFNFLVPIDDYIPGEFTFFQSADIDNDGDIDIVAINEGYWDDIGYFYKNNGNQSFERFDIIVSDDGYMNAMRLADLDGDGDLDLITSNDHVYWYEFQNGSFGPQQLIMGGCYCNDLYDADFDGDGDKDLTLISSNKVYVLKNTDGLGSFSSAAIISNEIDNGVTCYSADIDGDNDMDILSISRSDSKIAWYENLDGFGNFGGQQVISLTADSAGGSKIETADINLDGKLDIVSSQWHGISIFTNLGLLSNEILGSLNFDIELNNCTENYRPIPDLMINSGNDTLDLSTLSLSNGFYQFFLGEGDFETQVDNTVGIEFYDFEPAVATSSFSEIGIKDTINFCLTPSEEINDLNVTMLPLSDARPGFDAAYQIVYKNVGTTKLDGSLTIEFDDSMLNFLSSSEVVNSQSTNSLSFDFENIYPFETKTIDLEFNVIQPPTVNIDDVLIFSVNIEPIEDDNTPDDNIYTLNQTVIGSYDPNDIRVLEGEEIYIEEVGDYLNYIIRFQNTGTADAINVVVENSLDENLDWSTFSLLSVSHSNRVEILDGKHISFIFPGIYLPDSTSNEPESHGYIAYKIKPKNTLEIGDAIYNNASIFFDFNEPIHTNTVSTTVVAPNSEVTESDFEFDLYPIPSNGFVEIESDSFIKSIEVFDALGKQCLVVRDQYWVNISNLPAGTYYCKIQNDKGQIGSQKIVKL